MTPSVKNAVNPGVVNDEKRMTNAVTMPSSIRVSRREPRRIHGVSWWTTVNRARTIRVIPERRNPVVVQRPRNLPIRNSAPRLDRMDEYLAPRQESQGPLQSGAFHHVDQPARPERLHAMPGRAELGGRTLRQRLHGDLPFADAGREKARHRAYLEQLAAAHDADPVA